MFKAIEGGKDNTTYELESQGSFVIDENYLDNLFKNNTTEAIKEESMSKATVNTTTTTTTNITNIEDKTMSNTSTQKIGRKPAPATVTKTEPTEVKPTEETIKTPIVIPDDYDIASVSMSNKTYSAERLVKDISKNKAVFDNAVQRSDVWTIQQKSALITSMILGLPIPNMYANKNEEGVLDFLDGKQRSHAISDFMENNFPLTDVDPITIVGDDEKEIDINGYKFSELPELFKHAIQTYELHIVVFDNIDEDIANDIFDRLNSGTALTAIEKSRVKAVSLEQIQTLAKHEVFSTLSDKALRKYTDEDLITKMLKICFDSDKSLDTKEVRPYMRSVVVTEDMSKTITALLDRIYKVYTELNNNEIDDESLKKKYKGVARKIVTRTHLVTLVGFLYTHKSVTNEMLKKLVCTVFYGTNETKAKYNKYFANATSGAGHRTAVEARLECLDEIVSELTK